MRNTRSTSTPNAGPSSVKPTVRGKRGNSRTIVSSDSSEEWSPQKEVGSTEGSGDSDHPPHHSPPVFDIADDETEKGECNSGKRKRVSRPDNATEDHDGKVRCRKIILACRRFSVTKLIKNLNARQKEAIRRIGFGGFLKFTLEDIPGEMTDWMMRAFDPATQEVRQGDKTLFKLTPADVRDTFLLPMNPQKPVDESLDKRVGDIRYQWSKDFGISVKSKTGYYIGPLPEILNRLTDGGDDFIRLFVVWIVSAVLAPFANGCADFRVIKSCIDIGAIATYDWCGYVLQKLCAAAVRYREGGQRTFSGAFHVLLLAYVQRVANGGEFLAPYQRPFIANWTFALLRDRIIQEEEKYGFGNCSLYNDDYPISKEPVMEPNNNQNSNASVYIKEGIGLARDLKTVFGDRLQRLLPLPQSVFLDHTVPATYLEAVPPLLSCIDMATELLLNSREVLAFLARHDNADSAQPVSPKSQQPTSAKSSVKHENKLHSDDRSLGSHVLGEKNQPLLLTDKEHQTPLLLTYKDHVITQSTELDKDTAEWQDILDNTDTWSNDAPERNENISQVIVPSEEQPISNIDDASVDSDDDIDSMIDNYSYNSGPIRHAPPVFPEPWTTWPLNEAKCFRSALVRQLADTDRSSLPAYKLEVADFCIGDFPVTEITGIKAIPCNVRDYLLEMKDFKSLEIGYNPTPPVVTAWGRFLNRKITGLFPSDCVCLDAIEEYDCDAADDEYFATWEATLSKSFRNIKAARLVFVPCRIHGFFTLLLINFANSQVQYLDSHVHRYMEMWDDAAYDIRNRLCTWLQRKGHPNANTVLQFKLVKVGGEWRGGSKKVDGGLFVMILMKNYRGDSASLASTPIIQSYNLEELRASFCCDLVLCFANANRDRLLEAIPQYIARKQRPTPEEI